MITSELGVSQGRASQLIKPAGKDHPTVSLSLMKEHAGLAEAAALLIASKKIQAFWGEKEGD